MADIIPFPSDKASRSNESEEQWAQRVRDKKRMYVDNIVERYGSSLLNRFASLGFAIDEEDFFYDYIFIMELLKASLCHNVGIDNELYQEFQKQVKAYYSEDS